MGRMQVTLSAIPMPWRRQAAEPPPEIPGGAWDYVEAMENATEEPPELKGVVTLQRPDRSYTVLKWSGQTRPEVPKGHPSDIPAEAVRFNRVVIYVDGIHQMWPEQQRQIYRFLHAGGPPGNAGGNVYQPVIGIHQGSGQTHVHDAARIGKDLTLLKALQTGLSPQPWIAEQAFAADPAVKAIHDTVRQALHDGRDVQLMTHSGGGAETALALTLLREEPGGRWEKAIQDRVKVLSCASATSARDFLGAGVKPENLYYTGSGHDPVWRIFKNHLHVVPFMWPLNLAFFAEGAKFLVKRPDNDLAYHSPDYIFAANKLPSGKQRIQDFLTGGSGEIYPLP